MNNLIFYRKDLKTISEHNNLMQEFINKQLITSVAQRKTERYSQAPFQIYNPCYHNSYSNRYTSLVSFGKENPFPILVYIDNDYEIIKPLEKILVNHKFENNGKVKNSEVTDLGWLIKEMNVRAYFLRTSKDVKHNYNYTQHILKNYLIIGVVYENELRKCFQYLNEFLKKGSGVYSSLRVSENTTFRTYHIAELDEATEFVTLYNSVLNKKGLITTLLNSVQSIEDFNIQKVQQYLLSNK